MIGPASVNAQAADVGASLRDIRGPVGLPGEWLWICLLLGALLLLCFIWLAGRLWRKKGKQIPPAPQKLPWETALDMMGRLERGGYVQQGLVKEYYSQLSDIVRRYIEERFNVRAPEMTTEEFMNAVRFSDKLTSGQQAFLQEFLNASDMVKFAKFVPSVEQMFSVMRLARTFVEETR